MTEIRPSELTIRSTDDLDRLWSFVIGPFGIGAATLWIAFLDHAGTMTPVLVPIDGIPTEPDRRTIRNLALVADDLIDGNEVASMVALLARPGPDVITGRDRRWSRALSTGLGERLGGWPIYLATPARIQIVEPRAR